MIVTALIMGFAGSLHCLGMCSPLVIAVTNLTKNGFVKKVIYNSGRILMYGLLGMSVSSIGSLIPLGKYQDVLSIVLGSALIAIAVFGVSAFRSKFLSSLMSKAQSKFRNLFATVIQKKTHISTFILGALNALLPCGLTLIAMSFCVTLAKPVDGFTFMLFFGLGTLPVMLGLVSIFHIVLSRVKVSYRMVMTVLLLASGSLLIFRTSLSAGHSDNHPANESSIVICK